MKKLNSLICTADSPWDHERRDGVRVIHPDATELTQESGWPGGDLVRFRCPNCGLSFMVELPQ